MITHIPTGLSFNNRKEAKQVMGKAVYKRAVINREFTFHDLRRVIPFEKTTDFIDGLLQPKQN